MSRLPPFPKSQDCASRAYSDRYGPAPRGPILTSMKHSKSTIPKDQWVSRFESADALGELVLDPVNDATSFLVRHEDKSLEASDWPDGKGALLHPLPAEHNLIRHRAVLLPSGITAMPSEAELIADIEAYLERYVDLSPAFRIIASHYVLLTWVYDAFNELPYLRFRGEPGSGKTRALIVIGSLCYQAFLASGASTVSPIFHTLDLFRGTLVIDEADFRFSDEKAELVKILNNGNMRGFPVFRAVPNARKAFDPQAFHVFGPKLVAMRHGYADRALESRFLTEEMGQRVFRRDIPISLPPSQADEANALRNRLLGFRFAMRDQVRIRPELVSERLSPRLNQIMLPLLSIVSDEAKRQVILAFAETLDLALCHQRQALPEAQLLEILAELLVQETGDTLALSLVTARFTERFGADYERPITARYIGSLIRNRLHLTSYKTGGVFVIPCSERTKIALLCERYGVGPDECRDETGSV